MQDQLTHLIERNLSLAVEVMLPALLQAEDSYNRTRACDPATAVFKALHALGQQGEMRQATIDARVQLLQRWLADLAGHELVISAGSEIFTGHWSPSEDMYLVLDQVAPNAVDLISTGMTVKVGQPIKRFNPGRDSGLGELRFPSQVQHRVFVHAGNSGYNRYLWIDEPGTFEVYAGANEWPGGNENLWYPQVIVEE
jgi:hypothetical protein